MKIKYLSTLAITISLFLFCQTLFAGPFGLIDAKSLQAKKLEIPPIRIATVQFSPPFVLRGAHKQLYGYDIAMMTSICKRMNRHCIFIPVNFDELIDSVLSQQTDLAIGAITITAERAKLIYFSVPYLPSQSRFIARSDWAPKDFSLSLLNHKKIGVVSGTIFADQIKLMPIDHPTILEFNRDNKLIEAIAEKRVDAGLMDNDPALYWQNQSSDHIKALGKPLNIGFGYGIVVSRAQGDFLNNLNAALLDYQKSDEFKRDYQMYLADF